MSTSDNERELRERTERVIRAQRDQRTLPAKLEALAGLLERTVPYCDAISIAMIVKGRAGTAAWSSEIAIEGDLAQYRTGDGPCLLTAANAHPVRIDVMAYDERFVHFAPLALELGIESVLSMPLIHQGTTVGSANLYSRRPEAFSDATADLVQPVLLYAAEIIATSPLYVYSLELLEHLQLTVEEHDTIETAIGMLMEINQCDETTAVALLRSAADQEDRDLAAAARTILSADSVWAGSHESDLDRPRHG